MGKFLILLFSLLKLLRWDKIIVLGEFKTLLLMAGVFTILSAFFALATARPGETVELLGFFGFVLAD